VNAGTASIASLPTYVDVREVIATPILRVDACSQVGVKAGMRPNTRAAGHAAPSVPRFVPVALDLETLRDLWLALNQN